MTDRRVPGLGPTTGPRRWLARHRRVLAAALAAAAVLATAASLQEAASAPAVVAARDLTGGSSLAASDVRVVLVDPARVPAGSLHGIQEATGRVLAGPVRAGEVLTDVRLLGAGLLQGYDDQGLVATPVRIADAGVVRLLRAGDLLDVLAAPPQRRMGSGAGPARVVAAGVRVLTVPAVDSADRAGLGEGALIVLATSAGTAAALASASVSGPLSVTVLPR